MWCSLSALLVVLPCLAVMGQDTSDAPALPTSTSADTSTVTSHNALEKSESTVPKSLVESVTNPRSTSETTARLSDSTSVTTVADVSQQQSTWKPVAYSHPPETTSTAVTPSPSTHSANIRESSPTVSSQSPTTAHIEDTTGSTIQLTSRTVGALSTTGYLSQTTQGQTSSQPTTTHLMESSTTPGPEVGTNTNGSVHWATDEPKTDLTTTEVTSFSTPTTNTSEGLLGPGVRGKGQHPPSRGVTSTKTPTPHARPTTTASTAVTSSGKLRPAIPTAFRVTTRSRDRHTTAQAATKKIGLVTQCLIVIAFLAGLCTIFVICTIVLCTKLSAQRHNYRVNQMNGTELVCISALLPEEERKMRKKLRPKRLRDFTEAGKSSDTDDDDLTLHSFVTEH